MRTHAVSDHVILASELGKSLIDIFTKRLLPVKFVFLVCPSGSYLDSNNGNACMACPVDTYSTGTNVNSCADCPTGTNTQTMTGQQSSAACGRELLLTNFVQEMTESTNRVII